MPGSLMMKISLALLLTFPALGAEVLQSDAIAPGLLYAQYLKEGLVVHVLRLDLKQKGLHLRSIKAQGKETIRSLVDRIDDEETMVVAGINGDFFRQERAEGIPYGVQVSDGRLVFGPMNRSMIGFGPQNEPYIGIITLKARISFAPKAKRGPISRWAEVKGINAFEDEGGGRLSGIYIYTPAFLALTADGPQATVAVVNAMEPALQVGDVCEGTVVRVETSGRAGEVPESGCVIYFFGEAAKREAAALSSGSPVALSIELPPIKGGVSQAIGGGPRLIRDGKKSIELNRESFESFYAMEISSRHPRSAIGYDQRKQNLFLIMVEGRHEGSRGMTFGELATFFTELGCYQAMAFDGGGSAGMYVGGKGFVSKSMGGFGQYEERPVANGLLITTPKKTGAKKAAAKTEPKNPQGAATGTSRKP